MLDDPAATGLRSYSSGALARQVARLSDEVDNDLERMWRRIDSAPFLAWGDKLLESQGRHGDPVALSRAKDELARMLSRFGRYLSPYGASPQGRRATRIAH